MLAKKHNNITNCQTEGQLILKGLFVILEFFQKTDHSTVRQTKTNLLVCFLEESLA